MEEGAKESREPSLSLFDASADDRVRLLRRSDQTQKWIPHGYFPPNVTEETILQEFGGGRYWAQHLTTTEKGEGIKNHRQFQLVGAYKPPTGELPGIRPPSPKNPVITPSIPAVPGMGDLGAMFNATMITAFMDMVKTMKEVSSRPAPSADPMLVEMMRQQATIQSAQIQAQAKMMELMLSQKGASGDSKKEILELLASMKELVTPPAGSGAVPADPMKMFNNMLDTFKSFREAAEDVAPPQGTGDPLLDSLPKLVEVVAEEHQMRKQAQTRPALPASPPQPQPAGDVPLWKRVLQREAPRLIASARAGRDPETLARVAVEFAPTQIKGAITEFFHRDTEEVVQQMFTEIPVLSEQPQWMREFVENVQMLLFPDEFEEDEVTEVEVESEDTPTKE